MNPYGLHNSSNSLKIKNSNKIINKIILDLKIFFVLFLKINSIYFLA